MDSSNGPPILNPIPRRHFSLSSDSSSPTAMQQQSTQNDLLDPSESDQDKPISHSRSVLNLTSSTLFGIYAPTTLGENTSTPPTPWGTGAETPIHRGSEVGLPTSQLSRERGFPNGDELEQRLLRSSRQASNGYQGKVRPTAVERKIKSSRHQTLGMAMLSQSVLFILGVVYGALVARLRDNKQISPMSDIHIGRRLDIKSLAYLTFWGLSGMAMGNLLPWIDGKAGKGKGSVLGGVEWNHVVRSIGAFVGVTFAIRKLPWETTLQLSLTLALTNPFLWYLLDRTIAGLALSSAIGIFGTMALLAINPQLIPAPTAHYSNEFANRTMAGIAGLDKLAVHDEYVGVATWIASVLFCSCVCFGNIGRLLVARNE